MERFDHIIIGGGVLGLSIAYHLVRDSKDSVLVLERNDLAGSASSKAAGLLLQATSKPANTPLAKLTRETIPRLEEEAGEPIGFHGVGSVRIAASETRLHELARVERNASDNGIPFTTLGHEEARGMVKWLDLSSSRRITFFPGDGYIDPYLLSQAYARAARKLGAKIRTRTAVHDLVIRSGLVDTVRSTFGDVSGGSVIDAAGAWASVVSARAGYPLPMTPTRSHYWIAAPDSAYGAAFPVVLIPDCKAYMRPEVGGMVVGVQEQHSATFDARDLPDDINSFSPTRGDEHWDVLTDAVDAMLPFFPAILQAEFSSYVSGLSTYTPDGQILLGAVPGLRNLFAAAGCCGNGIALSAGIGAAVSALARSERPPFDLSAFAPDRFGTVDPFSQSFRDLCAAARAAKSTSASPLSP